MKNQQQAEREEQQRIKNLVLNLDLGESEEQDGETTLPPLSANANIHDESRPGHEKPTSYHHNRPEKTGKDRGQRVRKLQLSDVDWYDRSQNRCGGDSPREAICREQQKPDTLAREAEECRVGRGTAGKRHEPPARLTPGPRNQSARSRQR